MSLKVEYNGKNIIYLPDLPKWIVQIQMLSCFVHKPLKNMSQLGDMSIGEFASLGMF